MNLRWGQLYIEGQMEVIFDAEWTVIKLDNHKYYKTVSGRGLAGVDFLALHPQDGVAMIELKNYTRFGASVPPDIDSVMRKKQMDTLRLVAIVSAYYQRQWLYKIAVRLRLSILLSKEVQRWQSIIKHVNNNNYFFVGIIDQ